eukprot:600404-Pleurochrysis_carterae.AAC.2
MKLTPRLCAAIATIRNCELSHWRGFEACDATTATQSVSDASSATRLATSSRARSCPMPPLSQWT